MSKHFTNIHDIDSIRENETIDESSDSLPNKKLSSFHYKNELLVNLLIEECLPFSFTNSKVFIAFLRSFDPSYVFS